MAFTPFVETDQPTMAEFNEKFQECIAEALSHDVQIETGSYVGTGVNPVTLTFSFTPQFVIIGRDYTKDQSYFNQMPCVLISFIPSAPSNQYANTLFGFGTNAGNGNGTGIYSQMFSNNTLYWNAVGNMGGNYNGLTYSYVAIGKGESA